MYNMNNKIYVNSTRTTPLNEVKQEQKRILNILDNNTNCNSVRRYFLLKLVCKRPKNHEGSHKMIVSWRRKKNEN